MADKRSGPPSRGGFSKGPSRGGATGGSRGGPPRSGGFSGGGRGGPPGGGARGGFGGGRPSGDRPREGGGFGGRPSFGDRPPRPQGDRPFNDRPRRDFGDRPQGDRPPRGDFGDRPQRSFSDRPPRPQGDRPFNDRPRRDFGDRPQGDRPPRDNTRGDFGDRPQRSFSDRPPRPQGDRPFNDRPRRDYNDRPPRDNPRGDGDSFGAERAPRDTDLPMEDRPRRNFSSGGFGASRPRDDRGGNPGGGRSSFGDRPPRENTRGDFGDRPQRSFSDRPPRPQGDRPFNDRPKRDFGGRPQGDRPRYENRGGDDYRPQKREGFDKRPAEGDAPHDVSDLAVKGHEMVIYGVHAVQAALRNAARAVKAVWVTDIGHEHLKDIHDTARHPEPETMERRDIERRLPAGAVHQGVAVAVDPLGDVYLTDVLNAANLPGAERQVVVVLDEVTDPHNVGAVLRSMSMFGAKAMIVHKRNAPSVTGAMAKTATGAIEHIPMIAVTNLAQALQELQNAGFYCLGLDEDASITIDEAPQTGHIALVLGNEGEGLRALTRTTCDAIASIPSLGEIKSLNVSNAAAIALYSITRKVKA